jgi:hypothetical protein
MKPSQAYVASVLERQQEAGTRGEKRNVGRILLKC